LNGIELVNETELLSETELQLICKPGGSFMFLKSAFFVIALFALGCSHAEKSEVEKTVKSGTDEAKANAAQAIAEKSTVDTSKADSQKNNAKKSNPDSSGTKVECSVKGDPRIIEVQGKGNGCELVYTKAGKEGVVASATHSREYCERAKEKLVEKLKGAGYDCK
jgi:hypothetical protein